MGVPPMCGKGHGRNALSSLDPAFVKIDQVGHALDLAGPVGAAHGRQRLQKELLSGGRQALLDQSAVPLRGAHVGGQQLFEPGLDPRVVRRLQDNFLHRGGFDAEVLAEEAVEPAAAPQS